MTASVLTPGMPLQSAETTQIQAVQKSVSRKRICEAIERNKAAFLTACLQLNNSAYLVY
jgi:hypothetical protein